MTGRPRSLAGPRPLAGRCSRGSLAGSCSLGPLIAVTQGAPVLAGTPGTAHRPGTARPRARATCGCSPP